MHGARRAWRSRSETPRVRSAADVACGR